MKLFLVLLAALCLSTGCSSSYHWKAPSVQLQQRKQFYVETEPSDGKNLHVLIANELRAMGYTVTSGHLTMMPKEADTLVSFQSRWEWDFTTYLIELDLVVRDAHSGKILANSGYHRPAISGTSTSAMIQHVLDEIFVKKKAATAATPAPAPAK
jgi:hypothetical protein